MKAKLLLKERLIQGENAFVELVLWHVLTPIEGSQHMFKYRLAFIVDNLCVLRYDNEAGKGDHKHILETEVPYFFESPQHLLADFWHDVDYWRKQHE